LPPRCGLDRRANWAAPAVVSIDTCARGSASPGGADQARLRFRPDHAQGFSAADLYDALGKRSIDIDIGVSMGWCSDYPSAFDFPSLLALSLDSPKYERKLAAASRLTGKARSGALGKLDLEITRNVAPVAATRTYNNLYAFSNRVDPRSLAYQSVYQDWSIPALALK
jgi:hypothetical protein